MNSHYLSLALLCASAAALHRVHRDVDDDEQQAIIFPSSKGDGPQFGDKINPVLSKGKGGFDTKMRPSPTNNFRADNPTCKPVATQNDDEPIFTCQGDFPSVSQLKGVQSLSVVSGNFDALTWKKYIECRSLRNLYLSSCGITSIQVELFKTTAHLITLDLSGNRLAVIRQATFQGLTKIRRLNLARNEIALIEPGSFDSNQCLEHLDISGNQLVEFPQGLPSSLLTVLLSNNRLQQLTVPISLPKVVELNLCSNKISQISALRCPQLTKLCVGASNLIWDDAFLQASSLDDLRDVSFISNIEENVLPANVLRYLQTKLIHRLTIQDFVVNELFLPATLTHLSLIAIEMSRVDIKVLEGCSPKLVRLDLSYSKELATAFISSAEVLEKLVQIKQLILTGCGLHTLGWLNQASRPNYLPVLTECDIGSNALDCSDPPTKLVLCNANKQGEETGVKLLLDSVTCMATGKPFDYHFCTIVEPSLVPVTSHYAEMIPIGPKPVIPAFRDNPGHEAVTGHEVHDSTWLTWIIIIAVVIALLVIFAVIFVTYYCCKKKSDKYGEMSTSGEFTKKEAQPMLRKGEK